MYILEKLQKMRLNRSRGSCTTTNGSLELIQTKVGNLFQMFGQKAEMCLRFILHLFSQEYKSVITVKFNVKLDVKE